ncbi:hypothetical protein THAOC_26739, partial [Thalassiosira oceanica]
LGEHLVPPPQVVDVLHRARPVGRARRRGARRGRGGGGTAPGAAHCVLPLVHGHDLLPGRRKPQATGHEPGQQPEAGELSGQPTEGEEQEGHGRGVRHAYPADAEARHCSLRGYNSREGVVPAPALAARSRAVYPLSTSEFVWDPASSKQKSNSKIGRGTMVAMAFAGPGSVVVRTHSANSPREPWATAATTPSAPEEEVELHSALARNLHGLHSPKYIPRFALQ